MSNASAGAGFGRSVVGASSTREIVQLEVDHDKSDRFSFIDGVVDYLVYQVLHGERILTVRDQREGAVKLSLDALSADVVAGIEELFSVQSQQARGAWYLPDDASLRVGLAELPALFAADPRFGLGLAWEKKAKVHLEDDASAVAYWALIEPLLESIFMPLELRSRQVGALVREKQLAAWSEIDAVMASVGLDIDDELRVMRYGAGWSQLRANDQIAARKRYLEALTDQVGEGVSAGYRAHRLAELIKKYFQRAEKGAPTRQKVLTRKLERVISALFGGDWLAFLDYIDERPDESESITTAVPATRLFVGATRSAADVAAQRGVPVKEVERALATYWQSEGDLQSVGASPVLRRTEVIKRYWAIFDDIHAQQATGMRSLWGLVEDGLTLGLGWPGPEWHESLLYRRLLPTDLLDEIDELWGTIMLARWPDRIVTEVFPHALMARALGPALSFWHGCALTAWFICEGPYSRTDIAGMPEYYGRDLAALKELGCPVDGSLFEQLRTKESQLGPPEEIAEDKGHTESASGFSISMSFISGHRRKGFEILRETIDSHRRAWTSQYFDTYLRARWESELTEASREYAEAVADRSRPPTAKQFAKHAELSVNHWLGGDLSALYGVIGEKSPVHPQRLKLIPDDRRGFAANVFRLIGGRPFERQTFVEDREQAESQALEQQRHQELARLAEHSLRYLQLQEALGRSPTLKEFRGNFEYRSHLLDNDVDIAWQRYTSAIEQALRETPARQRPV